MYAHTPFFGSPSHSGWHRALSWVPYAVWQILIAVVGQSESRVWLCEPRTAACQASLSITNSWSLLKLMSTESVMPPKHLILCRPLLLLPAIFPIVRVFPNESALRIRWAKYWSFSISPCNEYSGLISFRMDWLDLLAAQGTLKSFLQQHSSKASILRHSAFFIVQLSHPYVTTGKTIALTMQTFVCKVMSLLFHTLSRFAVAFLPKSKCLFISGGTVRNRQTQERFFQVGLPRCADSRDLNRGGDS